MAIAAVLALSAAVLLAVPAQDAQAQSAGTLYSVSPMTRDLGNLKTFTASVPATYTTADQSGFNVSRVVCVFNQSAHTSSPSTTVTIQNKDVASGLYYTVLTSGAITGDATPTAVHAGAGVTTTANVSAGLVIARYWRVSVIVGGTGTTTATLGCSVQ